MQKAEFAARVQKCAWKLYRIARTMLRSDADCEDAVQEALLFAWAKLETLREERYFETWLVRILINECKKLRRRGMRPESPQSESIPAQPSGTSDLLSALMALPEKYRIALELNAIEGYSVRETAQLLKIPEGTVKWRLSRARLLLKQELGEEVRP